MFFLQIQNYKCTCNLLFRSDKQRLQGRCFYSSIHRCQHMYILDGYQQRLSQTLVDNHKYKSQLCFDTAVDDKIVCPYHTRPYQYTRPDKVWIRACNDSLLTRFNIHWVHLEYGVGIINSRLSCREKKIFCDGKPISLYSKTFYCTSEVRLVAKRERLSGYTYQLLRTWDVWKAIFFLLYTHQVDFDELSKIDETLRLSLSIWLFFLG